MTHEREAWGWSAVTPADLDVLRLQLGREPSAVWAVARRCFDGKPQVIVNDPLPAGEKDHAAPFPTLFWLTCPYLVKAVDQLESRGWIGRIRRWMAGEAEAQGRSAAVSTDAVIGDILGHDWTPEIGAARLAGAHRANARLRRDICDSERLAALEQEQPGQYDVLVTSGVAGMRQPDGVKCLHAHLADYLARPRVDVRETNPVGALTAGLLARQGVEMKGAPDCASCSL